MGSGGIVSPEVHSALSSLPDSPRIYSYAVGLGGRDIPLDLYQRMHARIRDDEPGGFSILDVDTERLLPEDGGPAQTAIIS